MYLSFKTFKTSLPYIMFSRSLESTTSEFSTRIQYSTENGVGEVDLFVVMVVVVHQSFSTSEITHVF